MPGENTGAGNGEAGRNWAGNSCTGARGGEVRMEGAGSRGSAGARNRGTGVEETWDRGGAETRAEGTGNETVQGREEDD